MKHSLIFFFLFSVVSITAQEFKASWISADANKATEPNSWYCYRKTFDLKEKPGRAIARIAVDTKYWLWINGKMIVYEGGLKRGPNPQDTYYDEVDLNPHLKTGKNSIAILTWFWGGKGFSHNNSGQTGLLFECTSNNFRLWSDPSWKAIQYMAYIPSTAPKPNFRLSEPNISFDAQKEIAGWQLPLFGDAHWPTAVELGKVPLAPWNKLIKRNIPLFRFDNLRNYAKTEWHGDTLICQLPYNGQFSPYLKISAKAGKKIFISTDTWWLGTYPGDTLNTLCSEYISKNGLQEYESLGWLSGHEIRYVIPKGAKVLSVMYRETGYKTAFAGSFVCNDSFLNTLWKKAQRTLYVNMRDNYMDCPDRERAQWAGDAAMEMAQAFYALDMRSTELSRKLYLDLAGWQKPDSAIYNPVPETDWKKELPAHSLMPLSELWRYFLFTKDTVTINYLYPALKKYLAMWAIQPNGQLIYRKGGWDWGDWGDHVDFVLIQHGWYLLALQTAANIALLRGGQIDYNLFNEKIRRLRSFLNSPDCWNGKAYRHKDYTKLTDDRANALMIMAGVADTSKWPAISEVFAGEEHASPWMEKFVLESLVKMGKPELALTRMKKRYKEMVESPLSTLWEIWEHQPGEVHGNSGYNHGWAGGPLVLLSQYYAGIFPDERRKDCYIIKPMLTGLLSIDAAMPTSHGPVKIVIKQYAHSVNLSCRIPGKITALIGLPKSGFSFKKITCNGIRLAYWKNIKLKGEDQQYYWIEAGNGKYNFLASW